MQAIILAAGQSSRLYPFADGVHKSMISLLGKPILAHTIEGLKKVGIKDVIVVVNTDAKVRSYLGNGNKFGVHITYVIQDKPLGMGNALLLAGKQIRGDFLLLHAYHIDIATLAKNLITKKTKKTQAFLLVKRRRDTWVRGVLKVLGTRVTEVVEKPKKGQEPSDLCIVGVYLFPKAFIEILNNTPQEHYQLEKAISSFANKFEVGFVETRDETITLKFPWDLLTVKNYLFKSIKKSIGDNVNIAKSAQIIGEVVIEEGVKIMEGVVIKGPCFLGKNVFIGNNAMLRNGVDVEEGAVVGAYMELRNSLIMRGATTHAGFIGDSIIGEGCKIGTQFCTANVRLDRETIKAVIKNEKVDSGLDSLGVMMGKNVRVGIKSSTMPGIIIGQEAVIGSSTTVLHDVPADTRYYTKFQEIIEEKK